MHALLRFSRLVIGSFSIDSLSIGSRSIAAASIGRPSIRFAASFASAAALLLALAAGAAFAATPDVTDPNAPRALPDDGAVAVRWEDPAKFSEIAGSGNRNEARRGDWVKDLALYLRKRTQTRLASGERLEITITDIRRAGNYEPWRGAQFDSVRFMREIYWPRIALTFKRIGADGATLAEGERALSDAGYLSGSTGGGSGDPLRYEKAMIDRWVLREFGAAPKRSP